MLNKLIILAFALVTVNVQADECTDLKFNALCKGGAGTCKYPKGSKLGQSPKLECQLTAEGRKKEALEKAQKEHAESPRSRSRAEAYSALEAEETGSQLAKQAARKAIQKSGKVKEAVAKLEEEQKKRSEKSVAAAAAERSAEKYRAKFATKRAPISPRTQKRLEELGVGKKRAPVVGKTAAQELLEAKKK